MKGRGLAFARTEGWKEKGRQRGGRRGCEGRSHGVREAPNWEGKARGVGGVGVGGGEGREFSDRTEPSAAQMVMGDREGKGWEGNGKY